MRRAQIEHCFIKQKRIRAVRREDGSIQPVRFYRPMPEGMDSVVEACELVKGGYEQAGSGENNCR